METSWTVIVFHKGCPDGATGAAIARMACHKARLYPLAYNQPIKDLTNERIIFIDITAPRETLDWLARTNQRVRILDHHETAQKKLGTLVSDPVRHGPDGRIVMDAVFDMNRSGATLAWDEFFPGKPRPRFVEYIEDHDLWRFHLPDSKAVRAAFQQIDFRSVDTAAALIDSFDDAFDVMVIDGRAITSYLENTLFPQMGRQAVRARFANKYDVVVCQTSAISLNSEFGNWLCTRFPHAQFAVLWNELIDVDGYRRVCSLRGMDRGVHVGEVVSEFDGGGHPNSAGCRMSRATFDKVVVPTRRN